ncbi:MAG: hypothetical protein LBL95_04660 [Deltaproteobacteria bacterium]|jgi:hypothetical protein|nr:hypothetical protein [Deltaproteobacteria bacterium]
MSAKRSQATETGGSGQTAPKGLAFLEKAGQFRMIARAAGLVFWSSMVLTVILVSILAIWKGLFLGLGALVGGAMVVADMAVLRLFVSKTMPGPLTVPLWKTVVRFYLVSLANMLVCFLVVKFRLGHPLGFLAGLGVFLPSSALGLLAYALMPASDGGEQAPQGGLARDGDGQGRGPGGPTSSGGEPAQDKGPGLPGGPEAGRSPTGAGTPGAGQSQAGVESPGGAASPRP